MKASAATSRRAGGTSGGRAFIGVAGALALVLPGLLAFAARCPAAMMMVEDQPATNTAPAPTSNQEKPPTGTKVPELVQPLPPKDAASVLGKKVKGPNGEDLGMVVDVLLNPGGAPRAAVIDFGGFLGVGSRKIAIDWKALDFTSLARAGTVELGLDRAQIAAAPEYKPDATSGAAVVTTPPAPPPVDPDK